MFCEVETRKEGKLKGSIGVRVKYCCHNNTLCNSAPCSISHCVRLHFALSTCLQPSPRVRQCLCHFASKDLIRMCNYLRFLQCSFQTWRNKETFSKHRIVPLFMRRRAFLLLGFALEVLMRSCSLQATKFSLKKYDFSIFDIIQDTAKSIMIRRRSTYAAFETRAEPPLSDEKCCD